MEIHKQIQKAIYKATGVVLTNYCHVDEGGTTKPYVLFDVDKEEFTYKIIEKQFINDDYIFTRSMKVKDNKDGTVEMKIFYEEKQEDTMVSDITEGGRKKYGIITREGKFYECGYAQHIYLEDELQEKGIIPDGYGAFDKMGVVKLTGSMMTECEFTFAEDECKFDNISEQQRDAIVAYIESLGRKLVNFNYNWYKLDDLKKILDYKDYMEFRMDADEEFPENGLEELLKSANDE